MIDEKEISKFYDKAIEYKCQECGINFITTEEAYTSGTSFLDNECPTKENYDKSRRVKRGLFKSNNGTLINADVNGSLQILKKVFPNAFADGIVGCLIPSRINPVYCWELTFYEVRQDQDFIKSMIEE